MSEVSVKVSFADVLGALGTFGEKVPAALAVAVRASIEAMIRDVVVNRMHNRGKYIGVVTGAGVRSVTGTSGVVVAAEKIVGSFGSSLVYIRAHELGFHGRVQVRAFERRIPSARRSARDKKAGGSGSAHVRAHTRLMNIRAKRFFADTLTAGAPGVEARLISAMLYLAKTRKVPTIGDLRIGNV